MDFFSQWGDPGFFEEEGRGRKQRARVGGGGEG